tara:strand:- start:1244 stop:1777 length:534 start_codon:yes stop_codon:yes gene_type:complete
MKKLKNSELNRISIEEFKNSSKTPIKVLLDNIRSAHNVGSIFRSCDAFLIDEIILCGITAKPPNKEIRKTALGSTDSMKWSYFENIQDAILKLKKEKYQIISVEQADKSTGLENFNIQSEKKYAIIFGNEINGVNQKVIDISDDVVEIPQFGTKHSFNVSVSVGIVIWDFFTKIRTN